MKHVDSSENGKLLFFFAVQQSSNKTVVKGMKNDQKSVDCSFASEISDFFRDVGREKLEISRFKATMRENEDRKVNSELVQISLRDLLCGQLLTPLAKNVDESLNRSKSI